MTTIMPTISRDLDGLGLYALAFAAPLASGVVGMVAAGSWSDRRGPAGPLVVSLALFSLGVLDLRARAVDGGLRRGTGGPGARHGRADREPVRRGRRRLPVPPPALDLRELRRRVGAARRCSARRSRPSSPRPSAGAGCSWASSALVVLAALPHRAGGAGAAGECRRQARVRALELYLGRARRGRRARGGAVRVAQRLAAGRARCGRRRGRGDRGRPTADAAPHAPRRPRTALGDRHPRPDERLVLLRPGLHRLRAPGALGTHGGRGRVSH